MKSDSSHLWRDRAATLLALGAHAGVWWIAFDRYPDLPSRIPIKFDLAGNAIRHVNSTGGEWFALPAIATLITLLLVSLGPLSAWLARENPEWINVPNKESFLKRDKEARAEIIAPIGRALLLLGVVVNALFAWILVAMERVASGAWEKLPAWPLPAFLITFAIVIVPAIVRVFRASRPNSAI
jgi:uncharacterized membrane protein